MTVSAEHREHAEATLRRWFQMTGVSQIHLAPEDAADRGWVMYARCGQHQEAAPDPELFFPMDADSDQTYLAQKFCLVCPVREYCDADATRNRYVGVFAGIYRDNYRRAAPLCVTPLCLNYRHSGSQMCRKCQARERPIKEAARNEAERERRNAAARRRRAAKKAALLKAREVVAA